jgi:hypothetical protein
MSVRYSVIYEKGPTSWGASVPDHLEALRDCGLPVPEPFHEIGEVEVTAA